MMFRLRYVLLALPLALLGCEKELEYDVESPEASLVVNSIVAHDSLWQVEVSTTAGPGQGQQIRSLKDAVISIYEDGSPINDIVLDSMDAQPGFLGNLDGGRNGTVKLYFHRTAVTRGHAGRNYELRVSHPNYKTVYSTSVIPRAARIRLRSGNGQAILIGGESYSPIDFGIQDEGSLNYYAVEVWVSKTEGVDPESRIDFYSADKVLTENAVFTDDTHTDQRLYPKTSGVFFSNQRFPGKEYGMRIFVQSSLLNSADDVRVRVLRLSPELYRFAVSYQKQLLNQENPFAEPAQVYSNIQNGTGIFGGYSVTELAIR